MKCTSDFECGNGANFTQVAPLSWRMNVCADKAGYDHFFMFRVEAESDEGLFRMEILPDPKLGPAGQRPWDHPPSILWRKRGSDGPWERMAPDTFDARPEAITLRCPLSPGEVWTFAETCPLPYSDIMRHVQDMPGYCPHVSVERLGETPEMRPLLVARITDPDVPDAEKGKVFVLAGQHGAEFGGMFAAKGALDFLASRLPQAAALRRRYIFDVIPCANPDGSSHGRCCHNSEGLDQWTAFEGASEGAVPQTAEARLIWTHIADLEPDLIITYHSYARPRPFGDPPYEGMYVPDPQRLPIPERGELQHVLNHALFYLTESGSQHRRPCPDPDHTLTAAAARAWNALSATCVVQSEEGPHRNLLTGAGVLQTLVETLELAQDERTGLG